MVTIPRGQTIHHEVNENTWRIGGCRKCLGTQHRVTDYSGASWKCINCGRYEQADQEPKTRAGKTQTKNNQRKSGKKRRTRRLAPAAAAA